MPRGVMLGVIVVAADLLDTKVNVTRLERYDERWSNRHVEQKWFAWRILVDPTTMHFDGRVAGRDQFIFDQADEPTIGHGLVRSSVDFDSVVDRRRSLHKMIFLYMGLPVRMPNALRSQRSFEM
jgi:hypothetical protein